MTVQRTTTVESISQDTRPCNVNAWNQDDQYVMQRQGIDAALPHDDFGFDAHCHVGLTCQMQGALERQRLSYLAHPEPQSIIIIIYDVVNNNTSSICYY